MATLRRKQLTGNDPIESNGTKLPSTFRSGKSMQARNITPNQLILFIIGAFVLLATNRTGPTIHQTNQYLSELTRPPESLDYGIELSYILPMDVLEKVAGINDTEYFQKLETQSFDMLSKALMEQGSIRAGVLGHRNRAPKTWTITAERHYSFEMASYISPPREEIARLMEICNETHFQLDPEATVFHINIDATNRTKEEVRRVYMNFMAVEEAINTILTPFSSGASAAAIRAIALGPRYDTVRERYEGLFNPKEFPYPAWDRRTLKSGRIIQRKSSWATKSDGSVKRQKNWRPKLCLTFNNKTAGPKSLEFRAIESANDPKVVWAWVEFARKFVAVSYAGRVLEPLERTPEQQWQVLFRTLIQDDTIESILREWRDEMRIHDPNRDAASEHLCNLIGGKICYERVQTKKRETGTSGGALGSIQAYFAEG